MITRVIAALGTLLAAAVFATAASAQTLSPGADPAASLVAGVRYRDFGLLWHDPANPSPLARSTSSPLLSAAPIPRAEEHGPQGSFLSRSPMTAACCRPKRQAPRSVGPWAVSVN